MVPDPVLVEFVEEWISLARQDLNNAQHDLLANPPFLRNALFLCQQTAEKAMKGLLTFHDIPFPKTHNLEELGELYIPRDSTFSPAIDAVAPLSDFAVMLRYPGASWEPELHHAQEAIQIARAFFDTILQRIPPLANKGQIT